MRCLPLVLLAFFLPAGLLAEQESYRTQINGTDNKLVLRALRSSSQTLQLQKKPVISLRALKRRAQSDVEKFIDIAKHLGFYSAKVAYSITESKPLRVVFHVDLGPRYTLESFQIFSIEPVAQEISLSDIHLKLDAPIGNQAIINAENALLWILKQKGYATCQITNKEIIADVSKHTLTVRFYVETGPLIHFGALQIHGNDSVLAQTIHKRIPWKEGELYNHQKVQKAQTAIEKTGLFSSVIVNEEFSDIKENTLPIQIDVQEGKHHSVSAGVSYTTTFGPGVRAGWENRNLRGLGEKLSFQTELWKKYQIVALSLTQPYFHSQEQDLIWILEYNKLHTRAFDSLSYNGSALIQRRLSEKMEIGFGARLEWLNASNFEGSHIYYLVKAPLQFKWSNANNLLDPTTGQTLNIKVTPTSQLFTPHFAYTSQTTSLSTYHSSPNNGLTLAARVVLGNIIGAARHTIPPPDRFFGGSENVLRGYRAFSVSPLHDKRIPIGGRSLLAGSLEMRFRTQTDFGWALFYDIGNVYSTNVPKIQLSQLHSVGAGIRYTTPIGPLRFDFAVPLRRRPHLDPQFQVYFSIGQSF